jgi:C_GCAxxG_C_C family probable redox protein
MPAGSAGAPIDPEALVRRADELFLSAGLTCSEAILQAGCEALGIEDPLVPGIALGLGGGVGQQGATCGILTGAALCISAAIIRTRPDTAYQEKKRRVMAATGTVFRAFQAEFGQTECRRICGLDLRAPTVTAGAKATIRVRVCAPRLAACARVLAGVLNELAAQRQ